MKRKRDPKEGTGKKPKGSDRRLDTDENAKETVSSKEETPEEERATVGKVKRINTQFARKEKIRTEVEKREKGDEKTEEAKIAKSGKEAIRRKHKRSK